MTGQIQWGHRSRGNSTLDNLSFVFRSEWPTSIRLRTCLPCKIQSRPELGVASAQPILTCEFDLAHSDSNKIGTSVPQLERRGESKCTSGRTNIDCNDIGVPDGKRRIAAIAPTQGKSTLHAYLSQFPLSPIMSPTTTRPVAIPTRTLGVLGHAELLEPQLRAPTVG